MKDLIGKNIKFHVFLYQVQRKNVNSFNYQAIFLVENLLHKKLTCKEKKFILLKNIFLNFVMLEEGKKKDLELNL
jgi:hypothetical protein